MTSELILFAVSVYENKLFSKFKNKLRAISCSTQQKFGGTFYLFCYFCQKFCISANFQVYCLKSGKLGIYLITYGRVKACLFRGRTRKGRKPRGNSAICCSNRKWFSPRKLLYRIQKLNIFTTKTKNGENTTQICY